MNNDDGDEPWLNVRGPNTKVRSSGVRIVVGNQVDRRKDWGMTCRSLAFPAKTKGKKGGEGLHVLERIRASGGRAADKDNYKNIQRICDFPTIAQ